MEMWVQIARGTVFLTLCSAIHLGLIVLTLPWLTKTATTLRDEFHIHRAGFLVCCAFAVIVLGHTAQVWVWAGAFVWYGAIVDIETAVYFSLTTYTTLGYGDIILGEDMRIFAAFASVCGLLTFGVSTAFLVGVLQRALPKGLH